MNCDFQVPFRLVLTTLRVPNGFLFHFHFQDCNLSEVDLLLGKGFEISFTAENRQQNKGT